jgi:hypothetical protein
MPGCDDTDAAFCSHSKRDVTPPFEQGVGRPVDERADGCATTAPITTTSPMTSACTAGATAWTRTATTCCRAPDTALSVAHRTTEAG